MTAAEPASTPITYFLNGKNLSGATGVFYGRPAANAGKDKGALVPFERLAVRLAMPVAHYDELHGYFTRKEVFAFGIHRGLQVRIATVGVISEVEEKNGVASCLVEFDLL